MIKVISIGTDRKLFEEGSAVLARNIEYASKMEELHIVVFSLKKLDFKPYSINNLYIYPTNSTRRWCYIFDAYHIAKKLIGHPDARSGREADQSVAFENFKFKIKNLGETVVSTQDPFETGLVGYFLKRKFNFPLQLQIHTDFLSPYFRRSFLNKIRVLISRFIIPRANGIRVVSEVISDSIKKEFPNLKIIPDILPIFIDIDGLTNPSNLLTRSVSRFEGLLLKYKFKILMASRLTKEKRIDIALRTFKKVISKFPHAGLIIAGDGDQRKKLQNLVQKLGLVENVVFLGWQNDVISLYKTSNLFLSTSEYEGYGISLIEAAASGCLIVTTKVGIAKTSLFINDKNCFICPVDDADCLSKDILELITNNVKRELFKQAMRDSIKGMIISREEYTAKYIGLLEKLMQQR